MENINFKRIYDIFCNCEECQKDRETQELKDELNFLIEECILTNKKLWNLEDIARMKELGYEKIALTKQEIDITNQYRNDLIQKIDNILHIRLNNLVYDDLEKFNSETPGMLIDRLTILFIKKSKIEELIEIIEEEGLKEEFLEKQRIISEQINKFGNFLDVYFIKVSKGEWFFLPQQPLKLYNNEKARKYIKQIQKGVI